MSSQPPKNPLLHIVFPSFQKKTIFYEQPQPLLKLFVPIEPQPQSGMLLQPQLQFELQVLFEFEQPQNSNKIKMMNKKQSLLLPEHLDKFPMETSLKICFLIAMLYLIQDQKMCYNCVFKNWRLCCTFVTEK